MLQTQPFFLSPYTLPICVLCPLEWLHLTTGVPIPLPNAFVQFGFSLFHRQYECVLFINKCQFGKEFALPLNTKTRIYSIYSLLHTSIKGQSIFTVAANLHLDFWLINHTSCNLWVGRQTRFTLAFEGYKSLLSFMVIHMNHVIPHYVPGYCL